MSWILFYSLSWYIYPVVDLDSNGLAFVWFWFWSRSWSCYFLGFCVGNIFGFLVLALSLSLFFGFSLEKLARSYSPLVFVLIGVWSFSCFWASLCLISVLVFLLVLSLSLSRSGPGLGLVLVLVLVVIFIFVWSLS